MHLQAFLFFLPLMKTSVEESGTERAIREKVSSPRKRSIARNLNKNEEYRSKLSKRVSVVDKELSKRREQAQNYYTNEKAESSRSTKRQFSLEELKYADFLQPKVVLSKALSVIISQMTFETERSAPCNSAIINLWFHNYAKPYKF